MTAAWFADHTTKTKLAQRYTASSLRLVALLLHHPDIVDRYLRVGELNFHALSTAHCMDWLQVGETQGANLAATVQHALYLCEKGFVVNRAVVEELIVPHLQGRLTAAQRSIGAELEREEKEAAAALSPEQKAQVAAEQMERVRAYHKVLRADLDFAAARAKEALKRKRADNAREAAIIRRRQRGADVSAADTPAAPASPAASVRPAAVHLLASTTTATAATLAAVSVAPLPGVPPRASTQDSTPPTDAPPLLSVLTDPPGSASLLEVRIEPLRPTLTTEHAATDLRPALSWTEPQQPSTAMES